MNKLELLLNKAIFVQKQINTFKEKKSRYKNMDYMDGLDGVIVVDEMPMDYMQMQNDSPGYMQEEMGYFTEEEPDWEGDMARTELAAIIDKATIVRRMLSPKSELPAWVQSKITLAAHDINVIHDYIKYKNYEC